MKEYPKIPGPYRRHVDGPDRNKLIEGMWSSPDLEYLAGTAWIWTEKVDGTNIRVHWDGHKVTYGGRTDRAQIPAKLIAALDELFREELFEQKFSAKEVTLYGEGYGAGIQKGGNYRPDMSFVLFDVRLDDWWLHRADVEDVAEDLGIACVPQFLLGPIHEAIAAVRAGLKSSWNPSVVAEGLVGVTCTGLLSRSGQRLMVKVKSADFAQPTDHTSALASGQGLSADRPATPSPP